MRRDGEEWEGFIKVNGDTWWKSMVDQGPRTCNWTDKGQDGSQPLISGSIRK